MEETCKKKCYVSTGAFCSVTSITKNGHAHLCAQNKYFTEVKRLPDWLVSSSWGEEGTATEEIINYGKVAEQNCSTGGAQRVREEEASPFCGCIEVGRRPAVNKLQM